jgi:hypothetical protein
MTPAKLEYILLWRWPNYVNDTRRVLFLIQTFKHHVVTSLLIILNKFVLIAISLDHKRVGLLTDFALKSLPEERTEVLQLLRLAFG